MTKETMSDAEQRVMQHLAEALREDKPDEVVVFTREEAEVLKEWARFMIAWKTMGKWGASLRQVILFFVGASAFYLGFRDVIEAWIRSLIK